MVVLKNVLGVAKTRLRNTATRRKLYNAEFTPSMLSPGRPPILPQKSMPHLIRDRKPVVSENQIENILEKYINRYTERSRSAIDGPIKKVVDYEKLPIDVRKKLELTSDGHVKLDYLLSYKYPLKIKTAFVEDILTSYLELDPRLDLVESLSEELFQKLTTYYLTHKRFVQVAHMIRQMLNANYQQGFEKWSYTIFSTLKSQYDLNYGFMDLMTELHRALNGDRALFKLHYTMLTNNERVLSFFEIEYDFEQVWKMIQLNKIIQTTSDVEDLPEPYYWDTTFDYINVKLGMKLFEEGKIEHAFEHVKKTRISVKDGAVYRLIASARNFTYGQVREQKLNGGYVKVDQLNEPPSDLESKVSEMVTYNPKRHISEFEMQYIFKFSKSIVGLNDMINKMADDKSEFPMKNMLLKKLLHVGSITSALDLILNNIDQIYKMDIKLVSLAVSFSYKKSILIQVLENLPNTLRNHFIILILDNQMSKTPKSKENQVPEKQFKNIHWILQACGFELTDHSFNKISPVLHNIPVNLQEIIISKISGPSPSTFLYYLATGAPLSSDLIPMMIKTNKINTNKELINLANHMAKSYTPDELTKTLQKIKTIDEDPYKSLHLKTTISLCRSQELQKCKEFLQMEPFVDSQMLFNEEIMKKGIEPVFPNLVSENSLAKIKYRTLKVLLDPTRLGFGSTLRKDLKELQMNHMVDGDMALLLLKKIVMKIKQNGEMQTTERLKWAISFCVRYGVEKEVIAGVLQS